MRKKISILAFLSVSSTFCFWKIERNLSIDNKGRIVGQTVKQQDIPKEGILQRSLLSYLRQQKENYEKELSFNNNGELSDNVVDFVLTSIWYPQVEKNPAVRMVNTAEKSKKVSEVIEAIDKCIFFKAWVFSRKYTNKDYVQRWNITHPQDKKTPESKQAYSFIHGLAMEKETNKKFWFYLDLKDTDIFTVLNATKDENTTISREKKDNLEQLIYKKDGSPTEIVCNLVSYGEDKTLSEQLKLFSDDLDKKALFLKELSEKQH